MLSFSRNSPSDQGAIRSFGQTVTLQFATIQPCSWTPCTTTLGKALAAGQTARLINIRDLASPFQPSRPTIRDYVTLLERVFLKRRFHQKITDIYAASIDYDEVACPAKESSRATASCACRACVALGVT